jgi:hypothetical protein
VIEEEGREGDNRNQNEEEGGDRVIEEEGPAATQGFSIKSLLNN